MFFLRNGNSTMSNPTIASTLPTAAATASADAAMGSPSPSTIKLLHQDPTIKRFGGEDPTSQYCRFYSNVRT